MVLACDYGLNANGYRKEPEGLREVPLPAIIHWNFNHFVVLCGFKNKVVLNDPARGRVEVCLEEFDESFTGIVLCFELTEVCVPPASPGVAGNLPRSG